MDTNEPRAYPPERNNGGQPKRGRGRPRGIPNPNGGREALPASERFPARALGRPKNDGPSKAMKPIITGAAEGFKLSDEDREHLGDILYGLKPQEAQFVLEYMVDMSAGLAARRCGISQNISTMIGCSMLHRPKIRKAVDALLEIRARNQALVANRLLVSLDELAHFDRVEIEDENGGLKPMSEWPSYARQALTQLDVQEIWVGRGEERVQIGVIKKARFVDPIRARELLGRHLRLWGEPQINVNQTNINAQNVQINQKIDLSDFTSEELQVALKLGLKLDGTAVELAPGLSGEEINESTIIGT